MLDRGYLSKFEGSHTPDPPFSFYGGPEVQALEEEWSDYYGTKHAVSVNSATSGLYAAIGALGIGFGDEVIVSPYTMSACAMAPMIYGAIPVFADVELETGSLDPESIKQNISDKTKYKDSFLDLLFKVQNTFEKVSDKTKYKRSFYAFK